VEKKDERKEGRSERPKELISSKKAKKKAKMSEVVIRGPPSQPEENQLKRKFGVEPDFEQPIVCARRFPG